MIVVDINLLLYATFKSFRQHQAAHAWFESVLNGSEEVLLPSASLFGFLRIATNPRVFEEPLSMETALETVEAWLGQPHVHFQSPGPRHLAIAFELLRKVAVTRDLTTDVQLAAHAIENQATLCSNDADFGRFDGLRWRNPLEPAS